MEVDENMKCSFHILEPTLPANKVAEIVDYILEDDQSENTPDPVNIDGQIIPIIITPDVVIDEKIRASIAKDVFVPQIIVNDEDSLDSNEQDSTSLE
jgi:hypothetical protein